jgi:hypothetical protein
MVCATDLRKGGCELVMLEAWEYDGVAGMGAVKLPPPGAYDGKRHGAHGAIRTLTYRI